MDPDGSYPSRGTNEPRSLSSEPPISQRFSKHRQSMSGETIRFSENEAFRPGNRRNHSWKKLRSVHWLGMVSHFEHISYALHGILHGFTKPSRSIQYGPWRSQNLGWVPRCRCFNLCFNLWFTIHSLHILIYFDISWVFIIIIIFPLSTAAPSTIQSINDIADIATIATWLFSAALRPEPPKWLPLRGLANSGHKICGGKSNR